MAHAVWLLWHGEGEGVQQEWQLWSADRLTSQLGVKWAPTQLYPLGRLELVIRIQCANLSINMFVSFLVHHPITDKPKNNLLTSSWNSSPNCTEEYQEKEYNITEFLANKLVHNVMCTFGRWVCPLCRYALNQRVSRHVNVRPMGEEVAMSCAHLTDGRVHLYQDNTFILFCFQYSLLGYDIVVQIISHISLLSSEVFDLLLVSFDN